MTCRLGFPGLATSWNFLRLGVFAGGRGPGRTGRECGRAGSAFGARAEHAMPGRTTLLRLPLPSPPPAPPFSAGCRRESSAAAAEWIDGERGIGAVGLGHVTSQRQRVIFRLWAVCKAVLQVPVS